MPVSRTSLCLLTVLLTVFSVRGALAAEVGILPPDLDYRKVCVVPENLQKDDFDWTGKTPASSGFSPEHLMQFARLYYNGNGKIAPDYKLTKDIVDYLLKQTGPIRNEALFLKYDMLLKGKAFPQNTNMAKDILNELIKNNDAKAHSRFGELYVEEANYPKAVEHFKKAFANGEPSAALSLAYLYHDKRIPATQEEIDALIVQAQDAAMQYLVRGNCHALTLFGLMYARLNNIPKAEYYSAKWYEKAAMINEWSPKLSLATIIQRGYVLPYDEAKVIKLWREAAALGSDRAMFLLGEHDFLNHTDDEGLKSAESWLRKSAIRHNIKAMELLAALYDGRYPAFENKKQQERWLEAALESPEVKDKSIMKLASLYKERRNIPTDKVFALYQMAAAKGNNEAYLKLGDAYRYGLGAGSSPVHALRYYRIAASNGETIAMEALEQAYSCGMGVDKDLTQSNFWKAQSDYYNSSAIIERAYNFVLSPLADDAALKEAENNLMLLAVTRENPEAMILLGLLAEKAGDGKEARIWLDRALASDEKIKEQYEAHALLGQIKLEGIYTKKNSVEGVALLEKASQSGNANAKNVLGKWYKSQGDLAKAKTYYSAAGAAGKKSALMKLAEIDIDQGTYPSAITYLEQAAAVHDVGAMLKLAGGYEEKGWAQAPDLVKSRHWFDEALKSYPCKAADIISISRAYAEGRYGVAKDEAAAEVWLNRVADMEPTDEKEGLNIVKAILSFNLDTDPKKRERALTILEAMAEKGNAEAASLLTSMYLDNSVAGVDSGKALIWVTKSAEAGDTKAMLALANMYMSGYGVTASAETARSWLEKASALGNAEASQRLKNMKADQ